MVRAPSALELLDVWEDGRGRSAAYRAVALLAASGPASREAVAGLSLGQRDAELLRLREALWGRKMAAAAVCPGCRERLELELDTAELLAAGGERVSEEPAELGLSVAGYEVRFRLPATIDVAWAEAAESAEAARRVLLERCVLGASLEEAQIAAGELPEEIAARIGETMAEADPLADIQLRLECPECGRSWRAGFDVAAFVWIEVEAWVRRTLREVHALARAYGWGEREILALSPVRRQMYLDMVGA
jgi:hypothetical protein